MNIDYQKLFQVKEGEWFEALKEIEKLEHLVNSLCQDKSELKNQIKTMEFSRSAAAELVEVLTREKKKLIEALTEIGKEVYELNPWTVSESNAAKIANKVLEEIK